MTPGATVLYAGKLYECGATCTKYIYAGGMRIAASDDSGSVRYFHPDHLGSTRVVTDGANSTAEWLFYQPYGRIESDSAPMVSPSSSPTRDGIPS